MKIKKNFILREVAGTFVVVAVGDAVKDFNMVINLNKTGAFIWKQLEQGVTKEEIVERLIGEYDVEEQVAKKDVEAFLLKITEANLLE